MREVVELDIDRDMELLVELLQMYSTTKDKGAASSEGEGPFSWKRPFGKHGVRVLFLGKCARPSKHRRTCKVFEHIYWLPKVRAAPWPRHVMTLHMTRVGEHQTHLRLECRKGQVEDAIFEHFVQEMFKLQARYAESGPEPQRVSSRRVESGDLGQRQEPMSGEEQAGDEEMPTPWSWSPGEEPWNKVVDHNWDRQALELWWEGYTHGEIAVRLHLSDRTVRNRITALRKIYGEEIAPTAEKLRRMGWK